MNSAETNALADRRKAGIRRHRGSTRKQPRNENYTPADCLMTGGPARRRTTVPALGKSGPGLCGATALRPGGGHASRHQGRGSDKSAIGERRREASPHCASPGESADSSARVE